MKTLTRSALFLLLLMQPLMHAQVILAQDAQPGDGGQNIAWVQQTLNRLGYDCGTVDGVMGAGTRSCIRAFQQANSLSVTGSVNEATYETMLELTAPASQETSRNEQSERERTVLDEQPESQAQPGSQEQPSSREQPRSREEEASEPRVTSLRQQVPSSTTGLYVRGYVSGNGVSGGGGTVSGRGFGAKLGYGFNPLLTVYVGADVFSVGVESIAYVDFGAQFNFRAGEAALVPYADLALSGIGDDAGNGGAGVTGGGGVKYFLSPGFALDGGLFLNASSLEGGGSVTGARLHLGVSWFPSQ